jgi:hypothetical protein
MTNLIAPSVERPDDFLTVTDSRGASITFERDEDGELVNVWIARPGETDGYSVLLGEESQAKVAAYLRGAK